MMERSLRIPARCGGDGAEAPKRFEDIFAAERSSNLVIAAPEGSRTLVEAVSDDIFEPKMSPDGSKIAYQGGGSIYVVDVPTGATSEVAVGRMASWIDEETLIVAPDDQ